MNLINGLAAVRELLSAGRPAEARSVLVGLMQRAAPGERWPQLVDLNALTTADVAHLEWFVRQAEDVGSLRESPTAPPGTPFTIVDVANGLARVRAMLAAEQGNEAQLLLRQLYMQTAAAQMPWLQFLVLDPPDAQELAYLEEYLRHHVEPRSGSQIQSKLHPTADMPSRAGEIATTFMTVRAMLGAGRKEDAVRRLRQLIQDAPQYESTWLQLLALDPPASEEIALLEGFLQHHPRHRFAQAFTARLEIVRTVAMLADVTQEQRAAAPRPEQQSGPTVSLGDYLIRQHWVTAEQIEHALAQQRALRAENVEQPLGTLLLMFGHVKLDQLAVAFAETSEEGFGSFADYLVRNDILTAAQVGQALATQAALGAQYEREFIAQERERAGRRPGIGFLTRLKAQPVPLKRVLTPPLGDVLVQMGFLTAEQSATFQAERQHSFELLFH